MYINFVRTALGLRNKRNIYKKEVIIEDPDYVRDAGRLIHISDEIEGYSNTHNLLKAPNPIRVFFREGDDRRIRDINEELEEVIEDLSNTRDRIILNELNNYPLIATHAHTRPFRRKAFNIITGLVLPLGVFFYLRMWRFRLRLLGDLRVIRRTNEAVVKRIEEAFSEKG